MNNPKVSVITICYNAINDIEKTILSVINQSYGNKEYIIIDGGSSDGTVDVIKKYESRISKWVSEPDKGIYDAINKGIRKASGDWINCMNAGDTFYNNRVLENIFSTPIPNGISVLYSDHIYKKQDGTEVLCNNELNTHVWSFNHQSIIYKKELHHRYGYYINSPKLIISDTLFFAPIPDEEKMKVNYVIAIFAAGGSSGMAGMNITGQNLCAEYIFKNLSFNKIFLLYYWKIIKKMIPESILNVFRVLKRHLFNLFK